MKKILFLMFALVSLSFATTEIESDISIEDEKIVTSQHDITYFGENLFNGSFKNIKHTTFNSDYVINFGDKININIWGSINENFILKVDNMGNIFIPKIGHVKIKGIKNSKLQSTIKEFISKYRKKDIHVYAYLDMFQPIQVFVSGNVKQAGLFNGNSNDNILQFLDKAGGISKSGTYRNILLKRDNKIIKTFDLYNFLINGINNSVLFNTGDVIFVGNKTNIVTLDGTIKNPFVFEFQDTLSLLTLLSEYGSLQPESTGVIIERIVGNEKKFFKFKIEDISSDYLVNNGDSIFVSSDFFTDNIMIKVEGEIQSDSNGIYNKNITLDKVIDSLSLTSDSDVENLIIYRKSVAKKQKQLLLFNLDKLEKELFSQNSQTMSQAKLSNLERNSFLEFIDRARTVEPKGLVVIGDNKSYKDIVIENGDTIIIPKKSDIVLVQGEVSFPSAHTFDKSLSLSDYIEKSGGYNDNSNLEEILIIHLNGTVTKVDKSGFFDSKTMIKAGDSIVVMQNIDTKDIQAWKDVTKIFYQIAVSAGVLITLF